jgi:hypothetical protein
MGTVKCCLCHAAVEPSGWCAECRTYPINVTPLRYCDRAHLVTVRGWCAQCNAYVLPELDAQPGEWRDTARLSRQLTRRELSELSGIVVASLSGPGWPELQVPLRRDMIPRRWKHADLRVVGTTPLGYDTVLPDGWHAHGIVTRP